MMPHMMSLRVDTAAAALICVCGALLFGAAAVHKLRDLHRFRAVLSAYALLPPLLLTPMSLLVPALEGFAAIGLTLTLAHNMVNPGTTQAAAPFAGVVLLSVYACAIAINLWRGRRDLDCGCGGPADRRPIAPWMVWRNASLAVLLAVGLLPWSNRPLEWTDGVTIAFGSATCALIYLCVDRLLSAVPAARVRTQS